MYVFQRETLDKHDIFIFLFWLLPLGIATVDHLLAPSILLCYTNPLHILLKQHLNLRCGLVLSFNIFP